MHAVWVTNEAGVEPRSGGGIRSIRLVAALANRMTVDVVAISSTLDVQGYVAATGAASATPVLPCRRSRGEVARLAAIRRWPLTTARGYCDSTREAVGRLVRPGSVVVVEHANLVCYRPPGTPYVLNLQNVDSRLAKEVGSSSRVEAWWNAATLRRIERRAVADRDALVVAVSDVDAAQLGPGCVVVPNGTDVPEGAPPVPARGDVLFVGSIAYPPNADAVAWWRGDIWPQVSSRAALTVVGRDSERLVGPAPDDSLRVVGEVADLAPYLSAARVVVLPLRAGSGTRLKLLEALAWGRPVVTTSKGAEGIPVVHEESALVADTAAEFAACVDRLLADDALAGALSAGGRRLAERYDWGLLTPVFVDAVERLARS